MTTATRRDLVVGIAASATVVILTPLVSRSAGWAWTQYLLFRQTADDKIYREVARGYHEHTPATLLEFLFLALSLLLVVSVTYLWATLAARPGADVGVVGRLARQLSHESAQKAMLVGMVLALVINFVPEILQNLQINRSVSYYRQLLAVDSPSLTSGELAVFESRFAQIRSKRDYDALVEDLTNIAVKHKWQVPEY